MNQKRALYETQVFGALNAENLQKVREAEEDAKASQAQSDAKAVVDQMRRDRKELATQLTALNTQLTAANEKISTTQSTRTMEKQ